MKSKNPYILLSIGLLLTGIWLTPIAYILLKSDPLSALGISMVILGAVSFVLGRTRPNIPPEVSTLLLETGLENVASIVEELGLNSKAIYLPSSITSGQPKALIPLHSNTSLPSIERALPKRMIVKFGPNPDDIGLLITTPGSATIKMLETTSASTSAEIENSLSFVLTGALDMVNTVRAYINGEKITVEVSNSNMQYNNLRLYELLGSPTASIVATLIAENLNKPIIIESEIYQKNKGVIELVIAK